MKIQLRGFSLIEMMIVLAILGILSALAYPSYLDTVRKGRRAEAVSTLLKLAVQQERTRTNTATYVSDMTEFGYANAAANTLDSGMYSVVIDPASATAFTITASEVADKDQANDDDCGDFVITQNGPDFSGTNATRSCWSQ